MDGEEGIRRAYESILRGDFEQAIEWFEQAIALEPDNAAYHYKLSITCARSSRLSKAMEHAREALRLDPDNQAYTFHMNHLEAMEFAVQAEKLLEQQGQAYMAAALLREAVRLDPLSSRAYLLLSVAYGEQEDFALAVQALQEALRLNPEDEMARKLLGKYKHKLHEYMNDPS